MITSILAGDTQLYHELIRPYERSVYMMALSLLKSEADAEEVAQEAFLKGYRSLSGFRSAAKFSTWLITITLNEARGRLRRQASARIVSIDEPESEGGAVSPALLRDWREIPSETIERAEVRELLQQAVTSLPDIYRQVFLLRHVEECSVRETAAALSISSAAVKVRLHRARMMLQMQLAPQLKKAAPDSKRRRFPWS